MKWNKMVTEEIDLGEIDARRDSERQSRASRDEMYNEMIVFDGKEMTRQSAIRILRNKIIEMENDVDVSPLTSAIDEVKNAKPGEEIEMPEVNSDVVSESEENSPVHPSVYVGTYAKYNNGSLNGEWVDLTDFDTYEDFVEHCRELHKDEKDPEFMIQDYEGYPSSMYHEGGLPTEEEFDRIIEISELDSDGGQEAYAAYLELGYPDTSIDAFWEHYYGKYTNDDDLGQEMVEMGGMPDNADYYFDYDAFGRDLMFDYHEGDEDNEDSEGNPEDPTHYYDNEGYDLGEYESDRQVAEDFIDSMGGVESLGKETINRYFDYAKFGREVYLNDLTECDGFLFWNH